MATSINAELSSVAECLRRGFAPDGARASSEGGPKPRLVHVLVGDGIQTNEAAAKRVLPWATRDLKAFDYFLVLVKCANHQVNLAIGGAIQGETARSAAGNGAIALLPDALTVRRAGGETARMTWYVQWWCA